jgi:hypothetical protein
MIVVIFLVLLHMFRRKVIGQDGYALYKLLSPYLLSHALV